MTYIRFGTLTVRSFSRKCKKGVYGPTYLDPSISRKLWSIIIVSGEICFAMNLAHSISKKKFSSDRLLRIYRIRFCWSNTKLLKFVYKISWYSLPKRIRRLNLVPNLSNFVLLQQNRTRYIRNQWSDENFFLEIEWARFIEKHISSDTVIIFHSLRDMEVPRYVVP